MEVCLTCCYSSRLPFIFINIYGVVCVQLAHFSLGDWEDISIAHVIIIIKSEVSTLTIIIFFRGSVPEMLATSYSVTYCIYIPGKPGFCFHYYCAVYQMSADSRIRFGLQIVFVCLYITPSHYHHCANLSEDIELMKCLSDIFCRLCEKDWAYFLSYLLYIIWCCVFSV